MTRVLSKHFVSSQESENIYNRFSVARTSLGPWKFVRDMGIRATES